ncbi:hypothetical protein B0H10DRAFT_2246995 [Mycena sp. CBHHK59/15]|nr:hypothetical protein B0H10DRAFT_2246995 [Mycena sp. CBHHK59/15]
MAPNSPQPKPSSRKGETKVNFGASGTSRKCKPSPTNPDAGPSSTKRARPNGALGSTSMDTGGAGPTNMSGSTAGTASTADAADANNTAPKTTPAKKTAVNAAKDLATKLKRDAVRISGPITNNIARIPETLLATVFTMILKAVQSKYNELHRHLAVSGFQFFSDSFALSALEVNAKVTSNTELLCDMYDNYTYGTLAQRTRMERRCPGSLSHSIKHGVQLKARARFSQVRFKTAVSLGLRKPVQRIVCIEEAHSDNEHTPTSGESRVREKPGRNPIVAQFFHKELDPAAEEYRKRNAKWGKKEPKPRTRSDPLLPASAMGVILPPDVPIDFFTPEFYNALTAKERTRYINTGVAFPLADFAFDEVHDGWKTMGKKEFMEMYRNNVLAQYNIPDAEEIDAMPDSDADDEEEVEINLEDTDDEEDREMEVDEDV